MPKFFAAIFLVILAACTSLTGITPADSGNSEPNLMEVSYKAADHLHGQLAGSGVAAYPMLAAAFVDSADVGITNDAGRLISEQIASRLSQLGYSLAEVQLRADQLAVLPGGGVFALSRDLTRINADAYAYSILLGTYTVVGRQIYFNARVLRTSDGVALASSDFSLPYVRLPRIAGGNAIALPSVGTRLE